MTRVKIRVLKILSRFVVCLHVKVSFFVESCSFVHFRVQECPSLCIPFPISPPLVLLFAKTSLAIVKPLTNLNKVYVCRGMHACLPFILKTWENLRFNLRHDRFTDQAVAKLGLFPRWTSKMRDSPISWRRLFAARAKSKEESVCLRTLQGFIACKILSTILQYSQRLLL